MTGRKQKRLRADVAEIAKLLGVASQFARDVQQHFQLIEEQIGSLTGTEIEDLMPMVLELQHMSHRIVMACLPHLPAPPRPPRGQRPMLIAIAGGAA